MFISNHFFVDDFHDLVIKLYTIQGNLFPCNPLINMKVTETRMIGWGHFSEVQ